MADDTLNLHSFNTQELIEQIHDDVYDAFQEEVLEALAILLEREWDAYHILHDVLVKSIRICEADFKKALLSMPEFLMACNTMKAGMNMLENSLTQPQHHVNSHIVFGAIKGNIYDINKNLMMMMLRHAGFKVTDIGLNLSAKLYIEALELHHPDILCLSLFSESTAGYINHIIECLEKHHLRQQCFIVVEGPPLPPKILHNIKADAYCDTIYHAVNIIQKYQKTGT